MEGEIPVNDSVEFYRREKGRLVSFVRSLIRDTTFEEAEDLVQEIMGQTLGRLRITGPVENLASYIYSALRNRVIDAYRKRARNETIRFQGGGEIDPHSISGDSLSLADRRFDPVRIIENEELEDRIAREISLLPPPLQAAFLLVEEEGLTHREAGEELGVSTGTVLSWKHRAVEILRYRLRDLKKDIQEP